MGPLAAIIARLSAYAARFGAAEGAAGAAGAAARGAAGRGAMGRFAAKEGIPHGAAVPRNLIGALGTPTRIGQGDIVQQEQAENEQKQRATEVLKKLTLAATATGFAFVGIPKVVGAFSRSLLNAQQNLSEYNTTIAKAFFELEAGRISRQFRKGAGTSGSTKALADSTNRLEEALLPFDNLWTNTKNVFGDLLNETIVAALNPLRPIADNVNKLVFNTSETESSEVKNFINAQYQRWLAEAQDRELKADLDLKRNR